MAVTSLRRTQDPTIAAALPAVNVVAVVILIGALMVGGGVSLAMGNPAPVVAFGLIGLVLMPAPRIAQQWERAVVLRFGRYVGLRGPGLFWIIPFVDRVSSIIDQRTIATGFAAEQTLTADTVRR